MIFFSAQQIMLTLQGRTNVFYPQTFELLEIGSRSSVLRVYRIGELFKKNKTEKLLVWNLTHERKSETFVSSAKRSIY